MFVESVSYAQYSQPLLTNPAGTQSINNQIILQLWTFKSWVIYFQATVGGISGFFQM